MRTYLVFWTYVANYASRPIEIGANSMEEAFKKAIPYDVEREELCDKLNIYVVNITTGNWFYGTWNEWCERNNVLEALGE